MTPQERAEIVYDIVRAGFTASSDDLSVVASDASIDGSTVRMTLTATRNGQPVGLNNPFHFVNPPLAVADGDTPILDPEAAVAEMLLQAVG